MTIQTADAEIKTLASSTNSDASITQDGSKNTGILTQAGTSNGATLGQTGNNNQARLYQNSTGATGNDATITQSGDNNILRGSAPGSYALQSGNANTLMVQQTSVANGVGNIANVNQVGNGNSSSVIQSNTTVITP